MTWALHLHPEAEDEFDEAAHWYASRQDGLGTAFVLAVAEAFAAIAELPLRYPLVRQGRPWRRFILRRFPYVVFYEVEGSRVVVMAVAQGRRRPGYWVGRRLE